MVPPYALDVIAFCALGTITETQQITHAAIEAVPQVEPEKVFEETLCAVSTASARAVVSAYAANEASRSHLSEALLSLPLTLHAYVAGGEVLVRQNRGATPRDTSALERMMTFYQTQIPDAGFPDQKRLRHAMILWMGRISPPGLPEHPEQRVDRLEVVERLGTHLRLVEAFARNAVRSA